MPIYQIKRTSDESLLVVIKAANIDHACDLWRLYSESEGRIVRTVYSERKEALLLRIHHSGAGIEEEVVVIEEEITCKDEK